MFYSIVTLTYNRPELLEESVYSVLQQTCQDLELLIINDFASQTIHYQHPQVRIFNIKDRFPTVADKRNFGLESSKGDWILQLDDDDFLLPTYLEDLKRLIGDAEWLSCQRPIIYEDDDVKKIFISPVPQANTFLCGRKVAKQFKYSSTGTNELNPFYTKTENEFFGKQKFALLPPLKSGHVWRVGGIARKKYSLVDLITKNIPQDRWNDIVDSDGKDHKDIQLNPKWSVDYTEIIKKNAKLVDPKYVLNKMRAGKMLSEIANEVIAEYQQKGIIKPNENELSSSYEAPKDSWQDVKPTWTNAVKFITAAKSRGLLSTALDAIGIKNNSGERVSDYVYIQRTLSCFGDDNKNVKPCDRLRSVKDKGYFCGSCGCGERDLARLDGDSPDEYNKLHYPQLECPLKRPGFSNFDLNFIKVSKKVPLSIIIPVLNDSDEINLTIESIRRTSPSTVEIIVIDDESDVPVVIKDPTVKLIRLETRLGVGGTRHLGASQATSDYLLFVDSHMRFHPEWYNKAIKKLITNPSNIVWCATCLGLEEGRMDVYNCVGAYYGARLLLYLETSGEIFEGKWTPEPTGETPEISCLMGACYFFHKSWFFHIGGTKSLKMWGSDEPLLSAKTYLSGGSIRLMKDVKIGHKFRSAAPYITNTSYLTYNKLRSIKMLFSDEIYEFLKNKFPQDDNTKMALEMLEKDKSEIEQERQYYKKIFTRDERWLFEKFNIYYPSITRVKIVTDHLVALDSPDHLQPYGTARDNNTHKGYILEVEKYFNDKKIKYLDIGCAGGQLVVDFAQRGHLALGVEGSDYGIKHFFANWPQFGGRILFTCDARKPFKFLNEHEEQIYFDCISSWEFLEHIDILNLDAVFQNVVNNLSPDGVFIGSISCFPHKPWHQTIMLEQEWTDQFYLKYFNTVEKYPFRHKVRDLHQSIFYCLKNPKK